MPVQCTCPRCGAAFFRGAARIKAYKQNFCSRTCQNVSPGSSFTLSDDGTTALIPIRRRDGSIKNYALVDAADGPMVAAYTWQMGKDGYAQRSPWINGRRTTVKMHRMILGLEPGDRRFCDHVNRDRRDNRRANLRVLTSSTNPQNRSPHTGVTSEHRGVSWRKAAGKWEAYVRANGKQVHLGLFESEEDAAAASRASRARLLPFSTD
jgi:hypothetical protein